MATMQEIKCIRETEKLYTEAIKAMRRYSKSTDEVDNAVILKEDCMGDVFRSLEHYCMNTDVYLVVHDNDPLDQKILEFMNPRTRMACGIVVSNNFLAEHHGYDSRGLAEQIIKMLPYSLFDRRYSTGLTEDELASARLDEAMRRLDAIQSRNKRLL